MAKTLAFCIGQGLFRYGLITIVFSSFNGLWDISVLLPTSFIDKVVCDD